LVSRLFWFGVVSGTGWLIDFGVFYLLIVTGHDSAVSNALSATVAVTFVFFTSTSNIFRSTNRFILYKFLTYLVYQSVAIIAASWAIQALSIAAGFSPMIAKIIVTPITFYANFQFMSVLTTGKFRLQ
jgi:putative flippase GtrA